MGKLRFTQIFRESDEKMLSDDEKLELIIKANPGKEDEIYDEYEDAKDAEGLDDGEALKSFWEKHKDSLEVKEDDKKSEDEKDSDEKEQETDSTDVSDETENIEAKADSKIEGGKSKLEVNDKISKEAYKILGIDASILKDFDEYETYFGYDKNGSPKAEVEVKFKTPEGWPVKTGDMVKNDSPYFHTVACMNEFVLYNMAVEIYNGEKDYKAIFEKALSTDKAGSSKNDDVKNNAESTMKAIRNVIADIKTGTAKVTDPKTEDSEMTVKTNIFLFIYTKVLPSLIKVAHTGKATQRVLTKGDNLYKKLFLIATEETDEANLLQNLILDGLCLFLGGMIGARAAYEGRIRGKALTGNANASTLSIFDNGWLDNESSKAKNFYLQMLTTFTEKNDAFQKWEIKNTKKTSGLGATKDAGINQHAYNAAASGKSWDAIELDHQTGAISDEEFEYIKRDWAEAHNSITSIKCEYEPFAMIAKKVSGQFGNFISTMTRAGASIANIPTGKNGIFGKPYYSQGDIDNEKDPKKKEEMISTNEAWKAAGVDLARLNVGDVSLSTPTGKDEKGTVGDLIADSRVSTSSQEYIDGKLDVKEDIKLLAQRIEEQFNFANSLKENDEKDKVFKANALYSVMCMAKFIYFGISHPEFSVRNTLDATIGLEVPTTGKNAGRAIGLAKGQDMIRWSVTGSDGSTRNPYYGTGTGEIEPNRKNAKPFDLIRSIRSPIGMTYLYYDNSERGEEFVTANLYNKIGKVYNKCYQALKGLGINLDATNDKGQSAIFKSTLYIPGQSVITSEIDQFGANFGDSSIYKKTQKDKKVTNWVACLRATPVTKATLEPLIDPTHPDYNENRYIVDSIKENYGVDLDELWKDGKGVEDLRGFMKDKNIGIYGSPDEQRYFTNSEYPNEKHDGYSVGFASGGKKNILINNSDKFKDVNGVFKADESIDDFFAEVFREAHKVEKRFSIK